MDNMRTLVGAQIRTLRKGRGWSQEDLGEKADLHHTYIGAVERGEKNASIDTLEKIAAALNIGIVDLFALTQGQVDVDRLRARIIEEVKESPPEILTAIGALIDTIRSAKISARVKSKTPAKKVT